MPSLGEKIKALREERKWSQRHLGEAVGVSNSAVSQWESDKVVPGYETLNALSSVFTTSLLAHTSDIEPSRTTIGRVPVLTAGDLVDGLPRAYAGKTTIEPSTMPTSQAFAFAMPDRGMSPDLEKGNLVIAESGIAAGPGDYVVARVEGEPTAIVRRFRVGETSNGNVVELVPNNGDFPTRRFAAGSGDYLILGVVVEIRWLRDVG